MDPPPTTVWTVGHSNLDLAGLVRRLREAGIERIADVRRFPRSRRLPHFSSDALAPALAAERIGYVHLVDLGGHRRVRLGSPHTGLAEAFRGYADHMETPAFASALARLVELARAQPTAVMCAEADWRSCHRWLLADRLVADGASVLHLARDGPPVPHRLAPGLALSEGRLLYRGAVQPSFADWLAPTEPGSTE